MKRPHAASPSARRRFASMETAPTMATTRRTAARQRRRCQPYGNCPKRHTNQEWVPGDAHNVLRRPVDQAFPRDGGGVRRGQADDDQQECRQHRCDGDRFPRPQLAPGGCGRGTLIRQNEPDHAGDESAENTTIWRCCTDPAGGGAAGRAGVAGRPLTCPPDAQRVLQAEPEPPPLHSQAETQGGELARV